MILENCAEFIFKEMINHKFLKKIDIHLLSSQFLSPAVYPGIEKNLFGR